MPLLEVEKKGSVGIFFILFTDQGEVMYNLERDALDLLEFSFNIAHWSLTDNACGSFRFTILNVEFEKLY